MARIKGEIDRRLCTVVVSGTGDKGVRVGIAEKRAVRRFGNEIGIAFRTPSILLRNSSTDGTTYSNEMAVFSTYGA